MMEKAKARRATPRHYQDRPNRPNDRTLSDLFVGPWYIEITPKGFKKVKQ